MAKKARQRHKPQKPPKFTLTFVKDWRDYRDMTQAQLAEAADMSEGYLSSIETGQQPYNQRVLEKLARALDTTVLALLSGPPTKDVEDPMNDWMQMTHEERIRSMTIFNAAVGAARVRG